MMVVRAVIRWLQRLDLGLNLVAAALGSYLVIATSLKGANWPSETFWSPSHGWFIAMLFAAFYVPLFAFYKYASERFAVAAADLTVAEADLALMCQQIALRLLRHRPGLDLDRVAVQVWLCDEGSGSFMRHSRFFLPEHRPLSGVAWRKGVGVAGAVWAQEKNSMSIDLRRLQAVRSTMSEGAFNERPAADRLGMTWRDFENTKRYSWVWATRLLSERKQGHVLGVLIVDYTGKQVDELESLVLDVAFVDDAGIVVGAIVRQLDGAAGYDK